jgi:hypothetical protein
MKMPLHIAQKLQQLHTKGQLISGSLMRHVVVDKMLEDGILSKKQLGKTKSQIYLPDTGALNNYLHNHFGIGDLDLYVEKLLEEDLTRAASIQISGDSKLKNIRTFTGFPVNVYEPIQCSMHGKTFVLLPQQGCFTFVRDYGSFVPDPAATIVGIENAENFSNIEKQAYLFKGIRPMFVSRFPQSNDLVKWLKAIPNPYLHFGDLDFEGVNIYLNEFKKHLGERAVFFIPDQTEGLLEKYGNRALYNRQVNRAPDIDGLPEKGIQTLLELIHRHKKVLEQEVFIEGIQVP